MVEITSMYAANVGALVLNLANRGVIVRIATEDSILGGRVLMLQLSQMGKGKTQVIKETLTETTVEQISDVAVIADALMNKLKQS